MRWEGITEFVAVADRKSFTLASKDLLLSTAQVSRQIAALEKRLRVKLFHRTTRKVALTEEGHLYYVHCKDLLDGLDAAEQALNNLKGVPQGTVNVSAPVTYGENVIIPILNDFVKFNSGIKININLSNNRVDLVESDFDLAIRLGQLEDSSLVARQLTQRSTFVCASPEYIKKFGSPHSLSELSHHNCLLGTNDYWYFINSGKEKKVKVSGSIRCNSGYGLVNAALKDIGVIQLPDFYVTDYIESGELIPLLEQYQKPKEGVWAVYPQNRYLSMKVKALIEFLMIELSKQE
ncbi:MAG: LysR family transcriptional regulator [Paraglaciecola sp.]|uniref:LysR family transcriptional regulator n=1 Tax=Paraglaciecola sp. TaxID=1920173 RepID=UPI0032971C35